MITYSDIKFKEMTKIINKGLKKNKKFSYQYILKTLDYLQVEKKYRTELKHLANGYISTRIYYI